MKRIKFVSITLSVTLISALGLGGCNSSIEPIAQQKPEVLNNQKQGFNVVSGKVKLDETANSSKTRSLTKSQADITAYNLSDNSSYKTTTDSSGNYELSGLSDGDYQIFAKNDRYAKNAVQRITLKKGTRQVVDFSLTAAGSVSGKISGAGVVYIPGTDHVSIADEDGNFALTGIPVGTYILIYKADYLDQREQLEVAVTAGAVTAIDMDSGFSEVGNYGDEFGYIDTSLEFGVLELYHEGIPFGIYNYNSMSTPNFKKYITLRNSAGEEIAFEVDYYDRQRIRTKEKVSAGEYTLTFAKEISEILNRPINEDRIYTFNVEEVSVASTNMVQGSRYMQVYFPSDLTDSQQTALADLKVSEKGVSESLSLRQVWSNNHELTLFGSFKTGVEYELKPTDAQQAILGTIKVMDDALVFGDAMVEEIYPDSGVDGVSVNQNIYVNVQHANQLDPSTVKFTLNSQEFSGKNIMFNGQSYSDMYGNYQSSSANISFRHDKLAYGTDYTLVFEAKDMSGNVITKTTTFKTMSPSIVDMDPESMEDLFNDVQRVGFNVPIDKQSGTITIENLTDSSLSAEIVAGQENGYNGSYEIYFNMKKLAPNQRYKITVSGYKDMDGVNIPEKTTEFSTPPKMLFVPNQYSQNMNVSGEYFNHKVNLFFFGGLSEDEKTFLEDNLVVTSYGEPITVDEVHPVRKLFFIQEDSGVMVSVAFTIDPDTNYELMLSSLSGVSDIVFPDNTKLVSFATVRKDDSATNPNAFRVIDGLSVNQPYLQEVYNETESSMKLISNISANVRIPLGYIQAYQNEYGGTEYESCWNKYGKMDYTKKVNDLIEESLHVNSDGEAVNVEFNDGYRWDINEEWINNEKMCYIRMEYGYQSIASFEADYNKTYEVSLDFTDTLQSNVLASNTLMTQIVKTDPVGTVDFSLSDYGEGMIMFNMYFNAPMKTDNLDELFSVKVNGEVFVPEFGFGSGSGSADIVEDSISTPPNDGILSADNSSAVETRTHLSFAVPRTLYSLLQLELSKVDGQDMVFINPLTGDEVINNSSLLEPVTFVEDVKPDLLPVKVEEIQTTSMQNNEIEMFFNRPVDLNDIVTFAEDGTMTNVAFEVKANDDTTVAIIDVDGGGYGNVIFTLAEELNVSKTYILSLKTGESIKAAFGAQKLNEFSQEIPLTYVEMGEMVYISQNGSVGNNPETPYILGSTDMVNASFDNSSFVMIPVNVLEGVDINLSKSSINVKDRWNMNNMINAGALIFDPDNMMLIQPITNDSYEIYADAEIVYAVKGEEFSIDANRDYLNRVNLPYVTSYYGNGINAITFRIEDMDYNYQITPANFVVYNNIGEEIDAILNVQLDTGMNNQPTVTFGNLEAESVYAVEIKGIPTYNSMPSSIMDMAIERIFIATPADTNSIN